MITFLFAKFRDFLTTWAVLGGQVFQKGFAIPLRRADPLPCRAAMWLDQAMPQFSSGQGIACIPHCHWWIFNKS